MSDRLAEIKEDLGLHDCVYCSQPMADGHCPTLRNIHWLVAEVERLRADLAEERQEHQATLTEAAEMRQRHAEAVEEAFREGWQVTIDGPERYPEAEDAAWLASEARKAVARD